MVVPIKSADKQKIYNMNFIVLFSADIFDIYQKIGIRVKEYLEKLIKGPENK